MTASGTFVLRCSQEVFSKEEIATLEAYGAQFERLCDGRRKPATPAQRRFVEVANGRCEPKTVYEKVWLKYLKRLEWESNPENRAAMGPRRRVPDDRADWKRMRGASWGEMMRRSRGLDDP